jgi:hypothetical protein
LRIVIAPSSFGLANKGIDLQFNILQGFYGTKKCVVCVKKLVLMVVAGGSILQLGLYMWFDI